MTGAVDAWLRELDEQLVVWGARRRELLIELEDGLRCAAADHRGRGLAPREAEAAAAAEFGDPVVLARDLAPELAASLSRTIALRLAGSGPVLGAVWLLALATSAPTVGQASLPVRLAVVVLAAAPLLPAAIAGTVVATGLAVMATGPGGRFPLRLAPLAAIAASAAVLAGDVMLLTALAARVDVVSLPVLLLLGLAGTASLTRIALSLRCAGRCLAVRAHIA